MMRGREREKETIFVTDWNAIIEYKITEMNLRSPDFNFFYNALESLLRSLNVDIEALKDGVPARDFERLYQIKFCGYVNKLYKLYDPSFNFYYLDLLSPTGKKCFHVLKMMHNYLKYYEMVKKEICDEAKTVLNVYNSVLEEKNKLDMHHESIKQRSQKINKKLEEYEQNLPRLREKVTNLTEREELLKKTCLKKAEETKGFEALLLNLELKENEMNEQVVCETEYDDVCKSYEMFQKEFIELGQVQEATVASNLTTITKMDDTSKCLVEINSIIDNIKISDYESLIATETKLNNELNKLADQKQKLKDLDAEDNELVKKIEDTAKQLREKERELVKIEEDHRNRIAQLIREKEELGEINEKLEAELVQLNEKLKKLEEQQIFLASTLRGTLTRICSTFQ